MCRKNLAGVDLAIQIPHEVSNRTEEGRPHFALACQAPTTNRSVSYPDEWIISVRENVFVLALGYGAGAGNVLASVSSDGRVAIDSQ
ncbi:unnamed protein product [Leptosia nina]|uniref:Uncharacterized protein n=1 Tax=Leptosia nina TaxID=320188 RepID=A0AAV1J5S7_9NEOP